MSAEYVIVVDSTCDLPQSVAEEWGLVVIPYIFNLDGKEYFNYLDYRDLPVKDFYAALRAGKMASTTQVTVHRYLETWEPILQEGKDVLYMCLSSALSKSYEQSLLASKEAKEKYPERTVVTLDTKSAAMGQALLAYYASKAKNEGKTIEENAAYIQELIPRVHHWVVADDLHHLRRGGRVSGAAAFIGTMLSVKPILHMLPDGKLAPLHKVRGRSKALEFFMEKMEEYNVSPKDQPIFICHGDTIDTAEKIRDMIKEKYGTKQFIINEIGPVVGAHSGPGTLAFMFLAEKPRATGQ